MKLVAVFVAILGVAVALPTSTVLTSQVWSVQELSSALQNPGLNPELKPYLENALNQLMASMFAGESHTNIIVPIPAGLPLEAPAVPVSPIVVGPGFETIAEDSPVIITPGLEPVAEGSPVIITPGLEPVAEGSPVIITPGLESVAEGSPVIITPGLESVVADTSASAPLVQIILNINQDQAAPSPVLVPSPVVVPSPVAVPSPESVAAPVVRPTPVVDAVLVDPVHVVDNNPEVDAVSVVDVAPAPINPVDILHPLPTPALVAGNPPIFV